MYELLNDSTIGGLIGIGLLFFSVFLWDILHK
jgi:hypothetical protein